MHQQFFHTQRIFIKDISFFIRGNMHPINKDFPIFNAYKCFLNAAFTHAQRLYLRSMKGNPALIFFLYKIIMICLLVVGNQLHCFVFCHYEYQPFPYNSSFSSSSQSSGITKSIVLDILSVAFTLILIVCPSLYLILVACPTIS